MLAFASLEHGSEYVHRKCAEIKESIQSMREVLDTVQCHCNSYWSEHYTGIQEVRIQIMASLNN